MIYSRVLFYMFYYIIITRSKRTAPLKRFLCAYINRFPKTEIVVRFVVIIIIQHYSLKVRRKKKRPSTFWFTNPVRVAAAYTHGIKTKTHEIPRRWPSPTEHYIIIITQCFFFIINYLGCCAYHPSPAYSRPTLEFAHKMMIYGPGKIDAVNIGIGPKLLRDGRSRVVYDVDGLAPRKRSRGERTFSDYKCFPIHVIVIIPTSRADV